MCSERNYSVDFSELSVRLRRWGKSLGFQQVGISDVNLDAAEARLLQWLGNRYHGDMDYMEAHGTRRSRPADLVPGTIRVISARMDYLPPDAADSDKVMRDPSLAMISRYALGRDYHKIVRKRLQKLADHIQQEVGEFGYRVFSDSAPVLEKALAENSGLGWIGKHTNLIARDAGSWFFLGEIYTDLPLPVDSPADNHCGTCHACIDICPTAAIVAPYELDARRCISYLTIELKGSIPIPLRPLIGNRIYGCDDCQLVCPWNRFSHLSAEKDFRVRHGLDRPELLELFDWSEQTFLEKTEGSAIRRIGYEQWLRNIAVALGNAPSNPEIIKSLRRREQHHSDLVREHVAWALAQQLN
ncbi:MAG: tRNA epoxyqueuosine(34) reductase QueG [Acidiferrobacterales bacterium]|jgi:epoxyqueuosine reductase|nr:tRNA epoxyqueuosine(34) reductase QueG [Acidiferrobacterales bacterium]